MPITTFQNILSTDKLQSGFRAKFNANVALLIIDITDNGDGTATVKLQGGTNFIVDLGTSFYTKTEVQALITGLTTIAWGSITGNVADQTDVVGNFGVLTSIDDILISCNFAVGAADADNPFFGSPASGYSSFSIPGIAGTGWQLLIKEDLGAEIKFRTFFSGTWQAWASMSILASDKFYPAATALPITMIRGNDFESNALRPIVNFVRALDSVTDTNSGVNPPIVQYVFTNSSKTVLASIIIPDNGLGSLEFDTWVRVV